VVEDCIEVYGPPVEKDGLNFVVWDSQRRKETLDLLSFRNFVSYSTPIITHLVFNERGEALKTHSIGPTSFLPRAAPWSPPREECRRAGAGWQSTVFSPQRGRILTRMFYYSSALQEARPLNLVTRSRAIAWPLRGEVELAYGSFRQPDSPCGGQRLAFPLHEYEAPSDVILAGK
jgi:hypothetical protein